MKSLRSQSSLSLVFMMKVMVWHFLSDTHKVMTALVAMLSQFVVVQFSLSSHRYVTSVCWSARFFQNHKMFDFYIMKGSCVAISVEGHQRTSGRCWRASSVWAHQQQKCWSIWKVHQKALIFWPVTSQSSLWRQSAYNFPYLLPFSSLHCW